MSAQSAKAALWAQYSALIDAFTGNQIPDQRSFQLPAWAPKDNTELDGLQYLSLLAAYQWYGKQWSPLTKQLWIETLHYYRQELYNWYNNASWPIGGRLATLSAWVQFLELASAYQQSAASQQCQDALQKTLLQLRLDLNQWALGTLQEDMDARIGLGRQFIQSVCK